MLRKVFFISIVFIQAANFAWAESVYIVGSGSVGSAFALALSNRNEVHVISETRKVSYEVAFSSEARVFFPRAKDRHIFPVLKWSDFEAFPSNAIVVLAVKASEIRKVSATLAPKLDGTQTLIFLQNGIHIMEDAPEIAAYSNRLRAMVLFGANLRDQSGLTVVKVGNQPRIILASDASDDLLSRIESLFESSGITVAEKSRSVSRTEWKKALLNIYVSGVTALCDMTVGEVLERPELREIAQGALNEALETAKRKGVSFSEGEIQQVYTIANSITQHSTSMREDLRTGRTTESPWLYSHVIKVATRYGISVPNTEKIARLIDLTERQVDHPAKNQPCRGLLD